MDQTLINWLFAGFGALVSWIMTFFYDRLKELAQANKELAKADTDLADRVHMIDKVVAGEYVKRDQLERMETALFAKLDRIERKLDGKVDKP